ncbi:hypothetical protein [Lederbergia galactosidilytica]|uniref:DUF2188 domain-containing protein n=1 Tax=Lederbergia galactosidilytica TaxID=217031 RepID=A0A178A4R3_9BACI|nr:hypothetical protein [Lederbergia galactosidilytica]KRG11146.1 hypothetical protein ACA30_21185 [Virgibacillus soli]OAK75044.1 hypothetical protein ABB05_03220 [Lederbergia galactosidilytica]
MPWTKNDYPAAFKNETSKVRNKAIEIANALLRENYDEGRAISIGLTQAREYYEDDAKNRTHYKVKNENDHWKLIQSGKKQAIFKENNKKDLLDKAKPYVTDHDGILFIYHVDGSLEDTLYK